MQQQSQSPQKQQKQQQLFLWYQQKLLQKNIKLNSLKQLSNGNNFSQIIHIYHPNKIDLSKVYIKPKNKYQILMNYKNLLMGFNKLGWKKFDPQRYSKQNIKDCILLAGYIKKNLQSNQLQLELNLNLDQKGILKGQTQKIQKRFNNLNNQINVKIIPPLPFSNTNSNPKNNNYVKAQSNLNIKREKLLNSNNNNNKVSNNILKINKQKNNYQQQDIDDEFLELDNGYGFGTLQMFKQKTKKASQNTKIIQLQKLKQNLLDKISQIQFVLNKESSIEEAKNKILQVIQGSNKKIMDE